MGVIFSCSSPNVNKIKWAVIDLILISVIQNTFLHLNSADMGVSGEFTPWFSAWCFFPGQKPLTRGEYPLDLGRYTTETL